MKMARTKIVVAFIKPRDHKGNLYVESRSQFEAKAWGPAVKAARAWLAGALVDTEVNAAVLHAPRGNGYYRDLVWEESK